MESVTRKKVSLADLRYIHQNKTAAILTASVCLGAMSANATAKELAAITKFGRALGLAFQVIDDILDVTQTSEKLGKSAGKDIAAKKAIAEIPCRCVKTLEQLRRVISDSRFICAYPCNFG